MWRRRQHLKSKCEAGAEVALGVGQRRLEKFRKSSDLLIDAASEQSSRNAPGLGFHPLKGKPKRWAVSVDENFRVIFRFEDGHALEVDYDDYH